jgi:hypothetical protein
MTIRREDLRGKALETYETWLSLGLSEAAAMHELDRDGLLDSYLDGFDRVVEQHRGWGLSEAGARIAATGRGMSEAEARRYWGSSPSTGSTSSASLTEGEARPTGPAAMVAFYRLMGEVHAWREAAKLADTDALRDHANTRADTAFQEALTYVPDRILNEVRVPGRVKPVESRRPAGAAVQDGPVGAARQAR